MSLRRLIWVDFIYASVRRHKDVSKRSDESTYQVQRHNNVSAWFGTFKLVIKWANFFCVLCSKLLRRLRWFSLVKVPANTLLQRLKNVGLIQVPVVTSLQCVKLVALTQVPVGTSLRHFLFFFLRTQILSFSFQILFLSRTFRKYQGKIIILPTSCVRKDLLLPPDIYNINFSFI